jgi:Protein of unknown function (DUF5818)
MGAKMKVQRGVVLGAIVLGISLPGVASVPGGRAVLLNAAALAANQANDPKIKTFTGTIAKKGDQFILTDDSKSSYQLDDQETAEKFAGKKVRVKGILDAINNTIRIQTIEIAAA